MALLITDRDVKQLPLSVDAAIPIMEETFRLSAEATAENGLRYRMPFKNGFMQFAPAALHSKGIAGFKLWANFGSGTGVHKGSPSCDYLYSMETGELLAIVHGQTIGRFRTSAVTAVAVKYLSPQTASTIGLYGAGGIAEGQIEAVCRVRPIKRIRVYSRTPRDREAFSDRMSARINVEVVPAASPEEVPRDADIIVTATTSEVPLLFGDWLTQPCLVVAAGANHWYKREIDEKVIERAELIVVDHKEHAKVESGNLLWAIAHGVVTWDRVEELGKVIIGRVPVPDFRTAVILFGSHGLATTDVAIAVKTYELAKERGLGTEIDIG